MQDLQSELDAVRCQLSDAEETDAKHVVSIGRLQQQLREEESSSEREEAQLHQHNSNLETQLQTLREKQSDSKQEDQADGDSQVETLHQLNRTLQSELDTLRAEMLQNNEENSLQTQCSPLSGQINVELNKALEQLADYRISEISHAQEVGELQGKVQMEQSQAQDFLAQISLLHETNCGLESELETLKEHKAAADTKVHELASQVEIAEEQPVQATALDSAQEQTLREEAAALFAQADCNKNGTVSHSELKKEIQKDSGLRQRLAVTKWKTFFMEIDSDGDGVVTVEEFVAYYVKQCSASAVAEGIELTSADQQTENAKLKHLKAELATLKEAEVECMNLFKAAKLRGEIPKGLELGPASLA